MKISFLTKCMNYLKGYFLFKCLIYDEEIKQTKNVYCVIHAESYAKAVKELEDYYCDNLLSFTIALIDDSLVFINKEAYDILVFRYGSD